MEISFKVNKQHIKRSDKEYVVAESKNYLYADFEFMSDEWTGTKTAIFKNDSTVVNQILTNDKCLVPHEVIKQGVLEVSVFAGNRVTVDKALVYINESGYANGGAPEPPTTDVYTQIIAKLDEIIEQGVTPEQLESAIEAYFEEHPVQGITEAQCQTIVATYVTAHKAELKGDKGDKGDTGAKGDTGEQGIQGAKGDKGEQGIQGVKGDTGAKGDKGDTPVKGVDYFTESDKTELVNAVINALPTAESEAF